MIMINLVIFFLLSWVSNVQTHVQQEVKLTSLGVDIVLNCTLGTEEMVHVHHWVIPHHLETVYAGHTDSAIQVSNDSLHLVISAVSRDYLGDYLCYYHVHEQSEKRYSRTTVWLYEPTVWVIYERNFMVGGIAAAAFFVIAITLCFVDAFRWKKKTNIELTGPTILYAGSSDGIVNGGFERDGYSVKRLPRCDQFVAAEYNAHMQVNGYNDDDMKEDTKAIGVTAM